MIWLVIIGAVIYYFYSISEKSNVNTFKTELEKTTSFSSSSRREPTNPVSSIDANNEPAILSNRTDSRRL